MKNYFVKLNILILILFVCHTANAQTVSVRDTATIGAEEKQKQHDEPQTVLAKVEPDDDNEEGVYKRPQRRMLSSQEGGLPILKDPAQHTDEAIQPSAYRTAYQKEDVKYKKNFFIDLVLAGATTSPKEGEGIPFAGYGVGIGYKLKNRHRFYIDLGVYEYWGHIINDLSLDYTLTPVTVSWNYVFFPTKKLHFRIGPAIGFASLSAEYETIFGQKIDGKEKIANSFLAGAEMGLTWNIGRFFKLDIGYKSLGSPGFNVDGVDFSKMLHQPFLSFGIKF